jgi:pullulanase/glycogen debranching enzyme
VSRAPWPGKPYPLGATWDGEGVYFALFSGTPRKSTLVVFNNADVMGRILFSSHRPLSCAYWRARRA